jgi:hypothetical protein
VQHFHYQVKIDVAFRLPLYHFQVKITVACQRLSLSFSGKDQAFITFILRKRLLLLSSVHYFHSQEKIAFAIKGALLLFSGKYCCCYQAFFTFLLRKRLLLLSNVHYFHSQEKIAIAIKRSLLSFSGEDCCCYQACSTVISGKDCCCYQAFSTFIIR